MKWYEYRIVMRYNLMRCTAILRKQNAIEDKVLFSFGNKKICKSETRDTSNGWTTLLHKWSIYKQLNAIQCQGSKLALVSIEIKTLHHHHANKKRNECIKIVYCMLQI